MLLGGGIGVGGFDIALPSLLLCHLHAKVSNLTLSGFTGISFTRFSLGFSTRRLSGISGFASRLFGRLSLHALTLESSLFSAPPLLLMPDFTVQLDLQFLRPGIFVAYKKSIPQKAICFSVEGSMIDALFNVAVFTALVLCIVGFSAWAHKRVP
jgi:hypothetical protein